MIEKEYDRTRVMPERIEAVNKGENAVKEFCDSVRERLVIEHPGGVNLYDSSMLARITKCTLLFVKYFIAAEVDINTGENSYIYVYTENTNGEGYYMHNLLEDEKFQAGIHDTIKRAEAMKVAVVTGAIKE